VIVIVTDKIYPKTARLIQKVRELATGGERIALATIGQENRQANVLSEKIDAIFIGNIGQLVEGILAEAVKDIHVVALNESALLPALALARALGLPSRPGVFEACDKAMTRHLLSARESLAVDFCPGAPGSSLPNDSFFAADSYIVKPAFGTSSRDVVKCVQWRAASDHLASLVNSKAWLPSDVAVRLGLKHVQTEMYLVEPFLDGTEFSVDGWIYDGASCAIVQHKLNTVHNRFFGDGPTISPPIHSSDLPPNPSYLGLETPESEIIDFGLEALAAIGFRQGVFHIEGREGKGSRRLSIIEINPRAPGGSLWKTFLWRTGHDLELVDAAIQLAKGVPEPVQPIARYVLHLPFYAERPGTLRDLGDLECAAAAGFQNLTIDYAVKIGHVFQDTDFLEETYLAFAATHDDSLQGLLSQCDRLLKLRAPTIN